MVERDALGVGLPGIKQKTRTVFDGSSATPAKRVEHKKKAKAGKPRTKKIVKRRRRRTKTGDRQVGKFHALVTEGLGRLVGPLKIPVAIKINSKGNRLTIEF